LAGPMEQFIIKRLMPLDVNGFDISYTNSSLSMTLSVLAIIVLFSTCLVKRSLIPNKAQCIPESFYEFVQKIVIENIGKEGLKYFSFIFTIFLFVFSGNLMGLFPYSFTFTSHFATVGTLSIFGLLFNIYNGVKKRKWGYFRTFLPKSVPMWLAPLIIPIEALSLISKSFSLTVRLVMNMVIGHIVLKIFAGFIIMMSFLGFIPLLFCSAIIVFELFIACLQAYIYTVLSCIYLSDALHEH
jgi:F-type H+-transporting ATPase subunit a